MDMEGKTVEPIQLDERTLRDKMAQLEDLMPDVSNADVADTVIGLMQGTVQFKDVQGFSDDNMEALYTVAYNAVQAGAFEKAEKLFRFLALFDNSQEKYWNGLGLSLFNQGNYDGALQAYSMATLLNIDDPLVPMRLAECHLALGDIETAVGTLEVALEVAGDNPEHAAAREHAEGLLGLLRNKN